MLIFLHFWLKSSEIFPFRSSLTRNSWSPNVCHGFNLSQNYFPWQRKRVKIDLNSRRVLAFVPYHQIVSIPLGILMINSRIPLKLSLLRYFWDGRSTSNVFLILLRGIPSELWQDFRFLPKLLKLKRTGAMFSPQFLATPNLILILFHTEFGIRFVPTLKA